MTKAPTLVERIDRAFMDLVSVDNAYPDVIEPDSIEVLNDCRTALMSGHSETKPDESKPLTGELEDEYENALVAAEMFDAPIIERVLTALHDELGRKEAEIERLKAENANQKSALKTYEGVNNE